MVQPNGPLVGATNKPSGSVELGVGAEIRPAVRHGTAGFRRPRHYQGTGRGRVDCMAFRTGGGMRKSSVLSAFGVFITGGFADYNPL